MRVNVSYEYYDAGVSFEPNFGRDGTQQFKLRAGDIWLWKPVDGWYDREVLQPFGAFADGSHRNHEPYIQSEWRWRDAWRGNLSIVASVDARNRTGVHIPPRPQCQLHEQLGADGVVDQ